MGEHHPNMLEVPFRSQLRERLKISVHKKELFKFLITFQWPILVCHLWERHWLVHLLGFEGQLVWRLHALAMLQDVWKLNSNKWSQNGIFNFPFSFHFVSCKFARTFFQKTKQAKPQLHFAPKIIKIRSIALENELIEVESLVPKLKRFANLSQCWLVCLRPRIR